MNHLDNFTKFKKKIDTSFLQKLNSWANKFPIACILDSNSDLKIDLYSKYDYIVAIDTVDNFDGNYKNFDSWRKNKFVFGYFHYSKDGILDFHNSFWFEPRILIFYKEEYIYINRNYPEAIQILEIIEKESIALDTLDNLSFQSKTSKEAYFSIVQKIQEDISNGEYYELNYCINFESLNSFINPMGVFNTLNKKIQAPMSFFFKNNENLVFGFSPERFLCKRKQKIFAQPIKGTRRRDLQNSTFDLQLKIDLENNVKELAENIIITDLVKNDLAIHSLELSSKAIEVAKVYTFPNIYQMVSTIECQVSLDSNIYQIIKDCLPIASMTGAPKKNVVKHIAKYENFERNIYSGTIGYFDFDNDFDLNVVIRTFIYDNLSKKLSIPIGSAITKLSSAEDEWEECIVKLNSVIK